MNRISRGYWLPERARLRAFLPDRDTWKKLFECKIKPPYKTRLKKLILAYFVKKNNTNWRQFCVLGLLLMINCVLMLLSSHCCLWIHEVNHRQQWLKMFWQCVIVHKRTRVQAYKRLTSISSIPISIYIGIFNNWPALTFASVVVSYQIFLSQRNLVFFQVRFFNFCAVLTSLGSKLSPTIHGIITVSSIIILIIICPTTISCFGCSA